MIFNAQFNYVALAIFNQTYHFPSIIYGYFSMYSVVDTVIFLFMIRDIRSKYKLSDAVVSMQMWQQELTAE